MKKISITVFMAVFATSICYSEINNKVIDSIKIEIQKMSTAQKSILRDMKSIKKDIKSQTSQISEFRTKDKALEEKTDSISANLQKLANVQNKDRTNFENDIQETNDNIAANLGKMDVRTMWGGGLLALSVLGFGGYLFVKRRKDTTSMDEVRKAQEALQTAQAKMLEDSIKLDNQMLMLIEKQMNATPVVATQAETDHSLALKVADEIVRIELNLSRMDSTVKGYKQLSKAVGRIKDNFQANGYEIVDMLGKTYAQGTRAIVTFVTDESLKENEQIISKIIKPQVNYKGEMIQSAQIEVSQAE